MPETVTVEKVLAALERIYPPRYAMAGDLIGLMIAERGARARRIAVALDPDLATVREAARRGAGILVTHHPMRLAARARLAGDDPAAVAAIEAIRSGLAVINAHTNADLAPGGLCDEMARLLGLRRVGPIVVRGRELLGRIGRLPSPRPAAAWLRRLSALFEPSLRVAGSPPARIATVAVCSGSGADLIPAAFRAGADAFIAGDIKYHPARDAETYAALRRERRGGRAGFVVVDAGHFGTERHFVRITATALAKRLSGVEIIAIDRPTAFRMAGGSR